MPDAGLLIADEKMNPVLLFIQHQVSSIQHRFPSSHAILSSPVPRIELELRQK
jgi:hypothetical protein